MRNILLILVLACGLAVTAFADGAAREDTPFARTVAGIKTKESRTISRTGKDRITVNCTILPHGEIMGVAWEIDNPSGKKLNITPSDMKVRDQVREFAPLAVSDVDVILHGERPTTAPPENKLDAYAPPAYLEPISQPPTQAEGDIYNASFPFVPTSSGKIYGLTYYSRYGRGEKITARITIDGEDFDFEF